MANPFKDEFSPATPLVEGSEVPHFEVAAEESVTELPTSVSHVGEFRRRFEAAHHQLFDDINKVFEDRLVHMVRNRPDLKEFVIQYAEVIKDGQDLPARLTEELISSMIDHFKSEGFDVVPMQTQFTYRFIVRPYP